MGHLLAIEHDTQSWIAAVIEDLDMEQVFHTNVHERVAALARIYTPTPVLLEELRRAEVAVAMIAALPAVAVARKHLFNQLATWLTTFADHTREHIAEIQALARRRPPVTRPPAQRKDRDGCPSRSLCIRYSWLGEQEFHETLTD